MKNTIMSIVMLTATYSMTTTAKADFYVPSVERSVNRGLLVEIILKCKSQGTAKETSSIMHYSKTEKLFCTAKNTCFDSARYAALESCNHDKSQTAEIESD